MFLLVGVGLGGWGHNGAKLNCYGKHLKNLKQHIFRLKYNCVDEKCLKKSCFNGGENTNIMTICLELETDINPLNIFVILLNL